jgi:PAS domain S-box-containing protein
MHSAVLAENTKREIILTNEIFCDLFDIPLDPDSMKGMDCSNAAQSSKHLFEDEEGFVSGIEKILLNKKRVDGELLKMKDGRVLERDFLPIYENGEYQGHIWKYQDITELMTSKESLKNIEDKYSKIIENLELGLIEVDLEEKITKAYPAFCHMTGYTEHELLGLKATTLLAFEEDSVNINEQNDLRRQGISSVYETKIRTKDGSIKWLIVSGTPIYDGNNNVVGSLGVHVDISDRKKLEEDLVEANEKALSSVKLKELFVANMSHEIRTPMNVILGMLDLIGEEGLNPESKKYIQTIKRSANSLLYLINDLLDYSKIEAGELQLEDTNVNLDEIFEHLVYSFSENAKNKGIQLLHNVDRKISSQLISDSSKLNQVLINLISNALKFTEKGFVKFECVLLDENELDQRIKFMVTDTGVGIAEENLNSIFQTFIQEDSSVSRKYGGTGLGLSISREIVARLGGEIHVQSEKGKGSTFSFDIVIRKGILSENEDSSLKGDLGELERIQILVAEDNPLNQTLVRSIFDQYKISFDLAENGEEAIMLLLNNEYDLILMDIQMPIMDGISATKHIRNTLGMDIPIIALTANASKEDETLYLSVGMNAYLAKPFKKEELFNTIFRLLKLDSQLELPDLKKIPVHADSIYSLKEIEEIAGRDDSFVRSIVDTFRINTPNYLNEMSVGIAKNDLEKIKRNAHQLKPSLDILCIAEGSKLIRIIEEEAIKNMVDKDLISKCYKDLKNILDAVMKDLYSRF